jgi:hypothetical protein
MTRLLDCPWPRLVASDEAATLAARMVCRLSTWFERRCETAVAYHVRHNSGNFALAFCFGAGGRHMGVKVSLPRDAADDYAHALCGELHRLCGERGLSRCPDKDA